MTDLCRLAVHVSALQMLYTVKACRASGLRIMYVEEQTQRLTLGSAVIVGICPFPARASGGSGFPWCRKEDEEEGSVLLQ